MDTSFEIILKVLQVHCMKEDKNSFQVFERFRASNRLFEKFEKDFLANILLFCFNKCQETTNKRNITTKYYQSVFLRNPLLTSEIP